MIKRLKIFILILALVPASLTAQAQSKKKPPRVSQAELDKQIKKSREDVIKAANEYKASLGVLLAFQEADVKAAAETVEKRKALFEQNIISKLDLEKSKQELATAQAKVTVTRKQMGESDNLIAEARAAEQLEKMPRARVGSYQATAALIRYNGASRWALADAAKVESFFFSRFRRALPISALGQTEVHNRLGFDHRNSVDVAVHPDSAEGQAVMSYLRSAGIPFIAFRQAVAGSATGAHIHIGYPSHRIAR
jgi:hypothetical protein